MASYETDCREYVQTILSELRKEAGEALKRFQTRLEAPPSSASDIVQLTEELFRAIAIKQMLTAIEQQFLLPSEYHLKLHTYIAWTSYSHERLQTLQAMLQDKITTALDAEYYVWARITQALEALVQSNVPELEAMET